MKPTKTRTHFTVWTTRDIIIQNTKVSPGRYRPDITQETVMPMSMKGGGGGGGHPTHPPTPPPPVPPPFF